MFDEIFDIKNDRRLGVYLYRLGFGLWVLYLVLGAPALHQYVHYRTDCGFLAFVLVICGFTASMVYEFHHHHAVFHQKKKWLLICYIALAALFYFLDL
jgi:hypothetical protein